MDLLFNLGMTIVDIGVLEYFRRAPGKRRLLKAFSLGAAIGLCLVVLVAWTATGFGTRPGFGFLAFRATAWILFLHLPLTMLAAGWLAICNRRSRSWPLALVSWAIGIAMAAVSIDAFLIEPTSLDVTYYKIVDPRIEHSTRIVLLADLQTDLVPNCPFEQPGAYQRRVFDRIVELQPDIVLLGGDYIHTSEAWSRRLEIRDRLRQILAESGFPAGAAVYGVSGNIDPPDWTSIFAPAIESAGPSDKPPSLLTNVTTMVALPEFDLTLLDVYTSRYGNPTIDRPNPDRLHIVLGHCPDYALGRVDADLLLAGHTHGGQVRIPLIGAVRTHSRIPNSWAAGMTMLPPLASESSDKNGIASPRRLIVSRGIGMECIAAPRLRFLCLPELVVIDLVPVRE